MSSRTGVLALPRRLAAWQWYLVAAPLAITLYYASLSHGTGWEPEQGALYASADAGLAVATVLAARRHLEVRAGLLLLAASAALGAAADLSFWITTLLAERVTYPSISDVAYLVTYLLLTAGLILIVRRRTPGWDLAGVVDAAIVTVGAGFLVYALVISPTLAAGDGHPGTLVSVAYPIGDVALIAVGARLLLGAGPRTVSLGALGTCLSLMLVADVTYSVQSLSDTYMVATYLDALWMAAKFILAAGLLHPSMATMIAPCAVDTPDATPSRLVLLALAALLAPGTMLVQHLRGVGAPIVSGTVVCATLFLLVLARMAGLVQAQRAAAITDGLTGLRSRGYLTQALHTETARSARSGMPVAMLLLDVDNFKIVNDTYGHSVGDQVLVEVAGRLRRLVRPGDLVARYGGEEFAVVLPGADLTEAHTVGERVRRGMAADPMTVGPNRLQTVTVSVGLAGIPDPCAGVDELVLAADRALYAAKHAGRNRVASAV